MNPFSFLKNYLNNCLMSKILIISKKKWDKKNYGFCKNSKKFILSNKINLKKINQIQPRIIFFMFWSNRISRKIFSNFLCIQFHSSNLPKFKGGSPIQNQILNKINKTKLTAFRINDKIDSGDICMKSNIFLNGKAENIYRNIEKKAVQMIKIISKRKKISFKKQKGLSSFYRRRKPFQSNISNVINKEPNRIYDFIRMLDADSYPKAYLVSGNKKFELYDVILKKRVVSGKFLIRKNKKK